VLAGDQGEPNLSKRKDTHASEAFRSIVETVVRECEEETARPETPLVPMKETEMEKTGIKKIKIVVPCSEGLLSNHFGHCEEFMFFDIENEQIVDRTALQPPAHEPGLLPRWLSERGANMIIAGGMGTRARGFFSEYGIQVVTGAPVLSPEKIVDQYLIGTLETGQNICDH